MLQEDFFEHVELVIEPNRGRELPGLFNPAIIKPLFLEQSRPWRALVLQTLDELLGICRTAVQLVLDTTAEETTEDAIFREIVGPAFEPLETAR